MALLQQPLGIGSYNQNAFRSPAGYAQPTAPGIGQQPWGGLAAGFVASPRIMAAAPAPRLPSMTASPLPAMMPLAAAQRPQESLLARPRSFVATSPAANAVAPWAQQQQPLGPTTQPASLLNSSRSPRLQPPLAPTNATATRGIPQFSKINTKAIALKLKYNGDFTVNGRPMLLQVDRSERSHAETGLNIWDGGVVLAKYLEHTLLQLKQGHGKQRLRCLELGCGTGVGGLGLALLGQDVVLSDQASIAGNVQANIKRNIDQVSAAGGSCDFAVIDWNKLPQRNALGTFDLVVASDVIWHENFVEPFMRTIQWVLTMSDNTELLLAQKRRDQGSVVKFEQAVQQCGLMITATVETEPLLGDWGHPDVVIYHVRQRR